MDLRDNGETGEAESNREFFYLPIPDEAPCKKEQEKLSGVVKNLHRKLRRKYKEGKRLHGPPRSAKSAALRLALDRNEIQNKS